MARIIFSALVSEIRGSIGGTTFQKNAYGYTIKSKPNMIKPNSRTQNFTKNWFVTGQRAWAKLSRANRTAWNTWASTFPQFAKNNLDSQLSGFQVFSRNVYYRQLNNLAALAVPSFSPDPIPTLEGAFSIALDGIGGLIITQPTWGTTANYFLSVFVSSPIKPSSNFLSTKTRFMLSRTLSTSAANDIASTFITKFGQLPLEGQKLQVRAIVVNTESGLFSVISNAFVTVTA